ncbi:MAG TPA: geranylgeranyl reductase family protein [Coxiellaceae bacterium]|nr:geranylgeranyl reductase family protein [Coxiellaceae bacterium]
MMEKKSHDVIIVGSGPAGASCAYNIKRFNPNASVLLIDKASFPRYKPCGGGISPDVKNYLDFDLTESLDSRCRELFIVTNKQKQNGDCDILMVRREHFDHFLVKKAQERGVEIITDCEVIDIENTKLNAVVKTKKGDFCGKIIVLAEGGSGKLARKLKIAPNNNVAAALEYEHYQTHNENAIEISFDEVCGGYAWVFPKSDGLSVGIGGFFDPKKNGSAGLPQKLKNYSKQQNINEFDRKHWHGHPIQLYSGRKKLAHNRIILIGEIAGCVDPLTAEGIRPAIKSAYFAAQTIAQSISQNNIKLLKKYNKIFHHEIGKDFRMARIASYFLSRNTQAIFSSRLSTATIARFMDIFSGRTTYRNIITFKKIFRMIKMNLFQKNTNAL